MAEAQDRPDEGLDATPPPEKAAAKKTPAKKAPAKKAVKKTPAKKAPAKAAEAAKKTPPRKAPAKKVAPPALEPPAAHAALEPPVEHAALVAGNGSPPVAEGARAAAANAKSSVEQAANPVTPQTAPAPQPGRSPLPLAVGFAAVVLIALLVHRLRRRHAE